MCPAREMVIILVLLRNVCNCTCRSPHTEGELEIIHNSCPLVIKIYPLLFYQSNNPTQMRTGKPFGTHPVIKPARSRCDCGASDEPPSINIMKFRWSRDDWVFILIYFAFGSNKRLTRKPQQQTTICCLWQLWALEVSLTAHVFVWVMLCV